MEADSEESADDTHAEFLRGLLLPTPSHSTHHPINSADPMISAAVSLNRLGDGYQLLLDHGPGSLLENMEEGTACILFALVYINMRTSVYLGFQVPIKRNGDFYGPPLIARDGSNLLAFKPSQKFGDSPMTIRNTVLHFTRTLGYIKDHGGNAIDLGDGKTAFLCSILLRRFDDSDGGSPVFTVENHGANVRPTLPDLTCLLSNTNHGPLGGSVVHRGGSGGVVDAARGGAAAASASSTPTETSTVLPLVSEFGVAPSRLRSHTTLVQSSVHAPQHKYSVSFVSLM
jgi:hypothetical protein